MAQVSHLGKLDICGSNCTEIRIAQNFQIVEKKITPFVMSVLIVLLQMIDMAIAKLGGEPNLS